MKELEVGCGTACTSVFPAPVITRGNRMVLQERLSAIRVREPKPSETSARLQRQAAAILSYVPKIAGLDSTSLFALVMPPPSASGYDLAALRDSDVDRLKDFKVLDKLHAIIQLIWPIAHLVFLLHILQPIPHPVHVDLTPAGGSPSSTTATSTRASQTTIPTPPNLSTSTTLYTAWTPPGNSARTPLTRFTYARPTPGQPTPLFSQTAAPTGPSSPHPQTLF